MPPDLHFDLARLDYSKVIADLDAIRKVNPQRFEMEQLDAIIMLDLANKIIVGYKDVRYDEFWVRGHLPGYPLMPGVLMCEASAQLCSYYTMKYSEFEGDFLGFSGMENVPLSQSGQAGRSAGPGRQAIEIQSPANAVQRAGLRQGRDGFPRRHHRRPLETRRGIAVRASRRLPLEALEPYLLDVPHPGQLPPDSPLLAPNPTLDFTQIFGNTKPVEIEIGFGKGMFLLGSATARPKVNFLGIEIERKYVFLTAGRLARRQLANVKLACTDARWLLRERVAEANIAALHVYFPDPWWKNRHRKRKLMTRDFADECVRVLLPGGRLHFITDVADYFAGTLDMLKEIPMLRAIESADTAKALTNFERKYRLEGRPIYRSCCEKTA